MSPYQAHPQPEPARETIDQTTGPLLVEFGAEWCPYCHALQPAIKRLLEEYPGVQHIKIEDGKGRPLGRSFHVKLWPTLVFMRDGKEVKQLVRPPETDVRAAFAALAP